MGEVGDAGYPDAMSRLVRWVVCCEGPRRPSSSRLGCDSGVRVWDTNGLGAFRRLTAREPLMRMARTRTARAPRGLISRIGRPGELSTRELGVLAAKNTDILCVRQGMVRRRSNVLRTVR